MDVLYEMELELRRRNYSPRTLETYLGCVKSFIRWFNKDIVHARRNNIKEFLDYLCSKGSSPSTLNVHLQAILFVFNNVLHKKMFVPIKYSRIPKKLPEVLTKEEVVRLFSTIRNEKHLLMVKLMYSAGLRISELVHLRIKDLEFDNNTGWVRKGKGGKDRIFIIANSIKEELKKLAFNKQRDSFLFSGLNGCVSTRTVYEIIKKAASKGGIKKDVHPHTLRHSFATHLIENGYSLESVQSIMGHASPETTMVYVHIAKPSINIKSPIDSF